MTSTNSIEQFLGRVEATYRSGEATEHSYRPALEELLSGLGKTIQAINEPRRVACGAPDFIIKSGEIAVGHVEAKDIDIDLENLVGANRDQKDRYCQALSNLIYTNCLDWEFYRNGDLVASVSIATIRHGFQEYPEQLEILSNLLKDFVSQRPQTITSPRLLAEKMAGKATLIRDILRNSLTDENDIDPDLKNQFNAFREHLIHDISVEDFSDIYAETIAYGMFAARLHDPTLDTFDRQEALELLPKSNPFLRNLFSYIAGPNLDDRIKWIIEDLAQVFQAADVAKLLEGFGRLSGRDDPFLHFYETFLASYNADKRKARGVWYTPEPVVNFIVRAVDEVLKSEFGLPEGLGDTSKVTIDWDTGQKEVTKKGKIAKSGKNAKIRKDVHRVQILDPAAGTGTFLAEVIKRIAPQIKSTAEGMWSTYIENDLIPRLHGFELLMASYAMCHMKLDMILSELEYKPTGQPPRLSVYLTNSLEDADPPNQTLPFAQWLTNEVKLANAVKRDMPIMCVIGNPPYNIMSGNLTPDQVALIEPYRYVDGKKIREKGMLQFEKNINNDYIKFIALSERLILRNGYGVLGFVTSHGYLRSNSFRGLRCSLMQSFDEIRILNLHGNSEVREISPPGVKDKNIFDIKQGVSVILAYRKKDKNQRLGRVKYADLWGTREEKYSTLFSASWEDFQWEDCHPVSPNYTFHPSGAHAQEYESEFFSLRDLMPVYSSGVITARDKFSISESRESLIRNIEEFAGNEDLSNKELCNKLALSMKKGWDITKARTRLRDVKNPEELIKTISYRPFDDRKIIFHESVVWTTARSTMDHMLAGDNIALVTARSEKSGTCSHFYVSRNLVETKCGERTTQSAVFPLYLYPSGSQVGSKRETNFKPEIADRLKEVATSPVQGKPKDIDLFDYVYGVLHCPSYRSAYSEFVKIDFPRIPWPADARIFWDIAEKGKLLRQLHLMDGDAIGSASYPFKGEGDAKVDRPKYKDGKVWINNDQYFDSVPEVSWNLHIGGYQPARKWLKDRKGKCLTYSEVKHYQRIIRVLERTNEIMNTITLSD